MVLDASLLNTQHYKVRIKRKVEQSREGVAPSPTPIEKGAFGSPSTMVANFYLIPFMLNRITSVKQQYLKPFNCVQKKWALIHLKIVTYKLFDYKSYIQYICIIIFSIK